MSGAVTVAQIREIEALALADGWSERDLIFLAGRRLAQSFARFFPRPGTLVGYLGKGHNAADALVALKILRDEMGWITWIRDSYPEANLAPLTQELRIEFGSCESGSFDELCRARRPLVLLDALLGIGSNGPMRSPLLELAAEMAGLRQSWGARVAAVDLPSGIDPDLTDYAPDAVTADVTFMIGTAKRGLLSETAATKTGSLVLVPIPQLTGNVVSDCEMICPQTMGFLKSPRVFTFHKGNAGRVSILAGSTSYAGAAVLAATGALRGGAGLITLHVPSEIAGIVTSKCPPEIIVRGISNPDEILSNPFDSLVVGCGMDSLTPQWITGFNFLLENTVKPVVLDAYALDLIKSSGFDQRLTDFHVLTPHPGEFLRLAPDLTGLSREEAASKYTAQTAATLVLKGCRTIIAKRNRALWCNSTGTPAMATGGQGDLLAGVIGALLTRGNDPCEAAGLAVWACGRAAEISMQAHSQSEESLTPSDVAANLGAAFNDWRNSSR